MLSPEAAQISKSQQWHGKWNQGSSRTRQKLYKCLLVSNEPHIIEIAASVAHDEVEVEYVKILVDFVHCNDVAFVACITPSC